MTQFGSKALAIVAGRTREWSERALRNSPLAYFALDVEEGGFARSERLVDRCLHRRSSFPLQTNDLLRLPSRDDLAQLLSPSLHRGCFLRVCPITIIDFCNARLGVVQKL